MATAPFIAAASRTGGQRPGRKNPRTAPDGRRNVAKRQKECCRAARQHIRYQNNGVVDNAGGGLGLGVVSSEGMQGVRGVGVRRRRATTIRALAPRKKYEYGSSLHSRSKKGGLVLALTERQA